MSKPEAMMIDDVKYIRADSIKESNDSGPKDIRIIILPRGWNIVGEYTQDGDECIIKNSSVIRRWGTTRGLGEIAENGPTDKTKLDPCNGDVKILRPNIIATIDCECSKWSILN